MTGTRKRFLIDLTPADSGVAPISASEKNESNESLEEEG